MLDCLRMYAAMGWSLFPCRSRNEVVGDKLKEAKSPLTDHGFLDATNDPARIEAWYRQFPGCAWGAATSAERGVMDVDPRHGGDATLAGLVAQHGALPTTPAVRTGGGGWHHWFRFPAGTGCGKPHPGIDRKADGGYVILPPSRIEIPAHEGRAYAWEARPWEVDIADAPGWLLTPPKGIQKPKAKGRAEGDDRWVVREALDDLLTHPGAVQGEGGGRTPTLCRLVGVHLARGDSSSTIYALAEAWSGRCTPPLDRWEEHVDGLIKKEKGKAEALRMTGYHHFIPNPVPPGGNGRKELTTPAEVGVNSFPAVALGKNYGDESQRGDDRGEIIPSFPAGDADEGGGGNCLSFTKPTLPPEAYHGLLGEMLRAVEPETEADPAGVLLSWLACFGSVVGRGAWVQVGPTRHHPALFVGVVGKTSDAKGDSWAVASHPFRQAEPGWASACIANGIGSGEGLVERVADERTYTDGKGEAQVIHGADDKRCLVRLSELSRCFKLGRRENATLSEYLREAWDGCPIHVPNRGRNSLSASEYTISLVGDITPGVLNGLLAKGTEGFDGFANRFLWCAVQSPRSLPSGGNVGVLHPFLKPLADALTFAKQAGEMRRNSEAEALWESLYASLKASGDDVPHTDRARPYALRLALLYALADRSRTIRVEHLRAAIAVWGYCRASAALLFGGSRVPVQEASPEPLWLSAMNAIAGSPGVPRSDLLRAIRGASAEGLSDALAHLKAHGLAYSRTVKPKAGGRPAECWWVGSEPENDTHQIIPPETPDAGKEGNNSSPESAPTPVVNSFPAQDAGKNSAPSEGDISFLPALNEALSHGGRLSYQWRDDLGSGRDDGPGCLVLLDREHSTPELDALCVANQDRLRLLYPMTEEEAADECLRSVLG